MSIHSDTEITELARRINHCKLLCNLAVVIAMTSVGLVCFGMVMLLHG